MYESIQANRILDLPSDDTWSDGTAGGLEEESITFEICKQYVDEWVLVKEDEIAASLSYLMDKHYWMVEGAAALALAALRKNPAPFQGKKLALILCGRKMSQEKLRKLL